MSPEREPAWPTVAGTRRERRARASRIGAALLSALVLHALVAPLVQNASLRALPRIPPTPIELVVRAPTPPPTVPALPAPAPAKPQRRVQPAKQRVARTAPAPPAPPAASSPAEAPAQALPVAEARVPDAPAVVRPPASSGSTIDRVLGTGRGLAPSAGALEGALDVKAEGPIKDSVRAKRNLERFLEEDVADDEVTAGLVDDYFQRLAEHLETAWRPATKELNDGGASVTQGGFLKSLVSDPTGMDEMWRAYMDLAAQYANGRAPSLEPARKERLRELMRSRKGPFTMQAICEVTLIQGPDGKVVMLDMTTTSGHPRIDEGVRAAFVSAIDAMENKPPERVSHGRSFPSFWRLRGTWRMVPPTALLSGSGFDITKKGLEVDVPFDIKLKTNVMFIRGGSRRGTPP